MVLADKRFEVTQITQTPPSWEQIRGYIIQSIIRISEMLTQIYVNFRMDRDDEMLESQFEFEVLSLYTSVLRAKIKRQARYHGIDTDAIDYFVDHPSQLDVHDAIYIFMQLTDFCEAEGITRTTMGTGKGEIVDMSSKEPIKDGGSNVLDV